MLVLEFKTYGKPYQFSAIDEAIRTTQFIRNKSIRLWMDGQAKSWVELSRHCAILAKEFDFANKLNSMARQAAAERAWASISRFYDNCKKKVSGKRAFRLFRKIVVVWNIKPLDGSSQVIANQSRSLTSVELGD